MQRVRFSLPLLILVVVAAASCGASAGREAPAATPSASPAFWERWGDGRAELDGYRITMPRYGKPREGHAVLIYVTEPMDSRTWIKDDNGDVPPEHRVNVLKLNHTLKFRTGIYPYSVMTSVFSPIDGRHETRFAPAKITFTAQEWCGHVFHQVKPRPDGFSDELYSYFGGEGERTGEERVPEGTLYEDALWIQLRELDGPFNGGKGWRGPLVPTLWWSRTAHRPLAAAEATIERSAAERDGKPVTRFVIRQAERERTIDVEREAPRRILGWHTSDGERAELVGSTRLPYWKLNDLGDESYLSELGLVAEK